MAFNPVAQDVFAVCSADLSVDLWRYARKNNELEKLSERNDVTPIGAVNTWLYITVFGCDTHEIVIFAIEPCEAKLGCTLDRRRHR